MWCGTDFETRADLDAHWQAKSECYRNRFVSNSYQPGSHEQGERPVMPGEYTLSLVHDAERRNH